MTVVPGVFNPQKIKLVFTWALPLLSINFIVLKKFEPWICTCNNPFLDLIFKPKFFNGSVTLEKSLFDKLLSPIIFIWFLIFAQMPIKQRARVPEFPALIIVFFFGLYPFNPRPLISNIESEEKMIEYVSKHLFEREIFYNQATIKIDCHGNDVNTICKEIISVLN